MGKSGFTATTATIMTQSTTSHHRRSPSTPHTIVPKSKPAVRPGLHRRVTSGVSLSISKLGSGHHHSSSTRSHSRGINKADDDFDMAASFLNFWYVRYLFLLFHSFSLLGGRLIFAQSPCRTCPAPCMPVAVISAVHGSGWSGL